MPVVLLLVFLGLVIALGIRRSWKSALMGVAFGLIIGLYSVPPIGKNVLGYASAPCWSTVPGWHRLVAKFC